MAERSGGVKNLSSRGLEPLADRMRDLIVKIYRLLITEAVGRNRRLFSRDYVKRLQDRFPLRFTDLVRLRKKIRKKMHHNNNIQIGLGLFTSIMAGAAVEVSSDPSIDSQKDKG